MKKQRKHTSNARELYVYRPAYPNAAEPRYFTDKMLDALTGLVSAMGFVTALICLVAMS